MSWTLVSTADEYLAGAGGYLRATPVEHTVELSAAQTLRVRGPNAFGGASPLFGWWRSPTGAAAAAAFHTPPYPLLISGPPEAARSLAEELAARGRDLPGVNGHEDAASIFAAAWREHTGATSSVHRRSRLFRLA